LNRHRKSGSVNVFVNPSPRSDHYFIRDAETGQSIESIETDGCEKCRADL
jgi:hypothetical protein